MDGLQAPILQSQLNRLSGVATPNGSSGGASSNGISRPGKVYSPLHLRYRRRRPPPVAPWRKRVCVGTGRGSDRRTRGHSLGMDEMLQQYSRWALKMGANQKDSTITVVKPFTFDGGVESHRPMRALAVRQYKEWCAFCLTSFSTNLKLKQSDQASVAN